MNVLPELAPFRFDLPPSLVAQRPPAPRGHSRLMLVPRGPGPAERRLFPELPELLPPGALLVFNQVQVTFCRLRGRRADTGGQVEAFILEPPPDGTPAGPQDLWCLVHPGRRVKPGTGLTFSRPGHRDVLSGLTLAADPEGRRLIRFNFEKPPALVFEEIGHVPLPFYIKRPDDDEDRDRYQTVFGVTPGAVAAPTAGLHFTRDMLAELKAAGFETAEVTLKVGAGTFAPLTRTQLAEGRLHREHISVPARAAEAVDRARRTGRPVVAVGTTVVRALEWAAAEGPPAARTGWGDLFIRPGYHFLAVDGLLTNFHLPGSSLIMLTAALAGREKLLAAYAEAVAAGFRFHSYGDAMLII
ncbi:MAG: tRNA preQ1(34) S-adenosylmethionine ribosyltransferase-isomerase QueA [Candidatus Adiutrix sp.]|jgi:S-adenosylmethionine:tRNA ribosyltransferase-isomerase|nr:tRNA preQ1(34) S-adenosylmethionine ribosyltransferase-isomerase QueA [Candidatus Adiutrix sp.]